MNSNLQKLIEIESSLPPFPSSVATGSNFQEYKMEKGVCFGWYMCKDNGNIAMHRWFNSKDTKFPAHAHNTKEWIILQEGIMDITIEGEKQQLQPSNGLPTFVYIPPLKKHEAYFHLDTHYYTITQPPAEEFPNG